MVCCPRSMVARWELTACYLLPLGYTTSTSSERPTTYQSSTWYHLPYLPTRVLCDARYLKQRRALSACPVLRDAAMRCPVLTQLPLLSAYALATRCPVLTQHLVPLHLPVFVRRAGRC
eukprot:1708775-Rhodomonas_salina.3